MKFLNARPKGIVQDMMPWWFLTASNELKYVCYVRIVRFAIETPTFIPILSRVSDGVELKWRLGVSQLDSSARFEDDPIYLQLLMEAAASFLASLLKPATFHAPPFLPRARVFLDELYQVYENLPGAKPASFVALLNLEIQQTSKTSHSIHTLFVNTMRLLEYSGKDKPLSW